MSERSFRPTWLQRLKRGRAVRRESRRMRRLPRERADVTNLRPRTAGAPGDLLRVDGPEWDEVKARLDAFAIPDGSGGVNPGDRRAIYAMVRALRPRSVLEVGTHVGASTVHLAVALERNGAAPRSDRPALVSVDRRDVNDPTTMPWVRAGAELSPAAMLARLGLGGLVEFVEETSLAYLSRVTGPTFDFIFLDGSHDASNVYREIPPALGALRPGGAILLHDYFPDLKPLWRDQAIAPGPYLATQRLRDEGAPIVVLPLGRLPWPTKLGSNVSSLALLLRDA